MEIFTFHSFSLYAYALVLSKICGKDISIMNNISNPLAFLGTAIILVAMIPIPFLFHSTITKFNSVINSAGLTTLRR